MAMTALECGDRLLRVESRRSNQTTYLLLKQLAYFVIHF